MKIVMGRKRRMVASIFMSIKECVVVEGYIQWVIYRVSVDRLRGLCSLGEYLGIQPAKRDVLYGQFTQVKLHVIN